MAEEIATAEIKEKANRLTKDIHLSLLAEGKPIYVNVQGWSMYPFIKSGDRIKITPANESGIKTGDIIAIKRKDKYGAWFIIHRVVKISDRDKKRIYFTKGDAGKKNLDEAVLMESIAGKVTEIERKNLRINLELSWWPYFNNIIAKLSFRHPGIISGLSRYIDWFIEWRLFPFRVKRRLKMVKPKTPLWHKKDK